MTNPDHTPDGYHVTITWHSTGAVTITCPACGTALAVSVSLAEWPFPTNPSDEPAAPERTPGDRKEPDP